LRDAIDLALALPDSVRALLAQWLRDDIPKSNGLDLHPPPATPKPHPAKAKSSAKPSSRSVKAGEKKLLAALRESPNQSAGALARVSGGARSSTQERLKRLAARGAIEKTVEGVADCGRRGAPYVAAVMAEPEPDRIPPEPAAARPPWVRPLPS
jgi:hypothetical protein